MLLLGRIIFVGFNDPRFFASLPRIYITCTLFSVGHFLLDDSIPFILHRVRYIHCWLRLNLPSCFWSASALLISTCVPTPLINLLFSHLAMGYGGGATVVFAGSGPLLLQAGGAGIFGLINPWLAGLLVCLLPLISALIWACWRCKPGCCPCCVGGAGGKAAGGKFHDTMDRISAGLWAPPPADKDLLGMCGLYLLVVVPLRACYRRARASSSPFHFFSSSLALLHGYACWFLCCLLSVLCNSSRVPFVVLSLR